MAICVGEHLILLLAKLLLHTLFVTPKETVNKLPGTDHGCPEPSEHSYEPSNLRRLRTVPGLEQAGKRTTTFLRVYYLSLFEPACRVAQNEFNLFICSVDDVMGWKLRCPPNPLAVLGCKSTSVYQAR